MDSHPESIEDAAAQPEASSSSETPATPPPLRHWDQPTARNSSSRRWLGGGAAAVVALGAAFAVHSTLSPASSPASAAVLARPHWSAGSGTGAWPGSASSRGGALGQPTTTASDAQQTGVVDIDVLLGSGGMAAGTGMVLTPNGEVLTNRHVVSDATRLSVTVPATGRSYSAHVVGVASNNDVAVVQLDGASGLATVKPATHGVSVGDTVVGVGNAGGQGGRPSAAPGQVTDVDQSITATGEDGSDPEQLTGLIETDAAIEPGDSGGPLYDATNAVVGMDTAGSAAGSDGYAIPIDTALAAARQIESGGGASTTQPAPAPSAFLGVEVQDGPAGVQVVGVTDGSPASSAGLANGDTITSVGGERIGSTADLASALGSLSPGQTVSVTWIDQDGQAQSAPVTLGSSAS